MDSLLLLSLFENAISIWGTNANAERLIRDDA